MQRSRVEALHVIERDRRIDHKSEQSGSDHVPESDSNEVVYRPSVALHPRRESPVAQVVNCGVRHHRQRYHLQRAEYGTERRCDRRRAREVQVVAGADDPTGEENGGRKQRRPGRKRRADQPQAGEEECDDGSRKDLKEAFDPQVHNPPTPIFHDGKVRVLPQVRPAP